jgi:ABC-type polysaccharide/polyol phosphate export permease
MSYVSALTSSRDLLVNLTLREIRGKYKRTVLGQAWSLLNPVAQMITYSLVFGFVLRSNPAPGNPSGLDVFALWLTAALLPWLFFSNVVNTGMNALVGNANLIQKVAFPRETLVIANALSWLFTFSIEMLVLTVALVCFGGSPLLYLPATIFLMLVLAVFGLGVSLILSVANVYFRDTQHFVAIFMQLWFYASPIIYPDFLVTNRLKHRHETLLMLYGWNPIERFCAAFRNTMYDGRWPGAVNVLTLVVIAAATLALGYWVFKRYEGRLAEEL